eukprot:TRINITY_DN5740_c5_g1_i1.p2 TRINITY_DN5740_c5_g1~~TRINITY_DN5740_c5_g1_i1.p2  ORF type:complete len:335 (+),score=93.58 TRINITY_DN5740_c5_g1_i1:78-1082(+)
MGATSHGDVDAEVGYLSPAAAAAGLPYGEFGGRGELLQYRGVRMRDARAAFGTDAPPAAAAAALRDRGFAVIPWRTSVHDRLTEIENPSYYKPDASPESERSKKVSVPFFRACADLMKQLTGASRAFVVSHVIRSGHRSNEGVGYITRHAHFVHADYCDDLLQLETDILTRKGLSKEEAETMEIGVYNIWIPTVPVVESNPMAVLDYDSLKPSDLHRVNVSPGLASDMQKRWRSDENGLVYLHGRIWMATYNPEHKWWYYPAMKWDEALVFTQLDPRPGRANTVVHTSFRDPRQPRGAVRSSVEVRICCAFPRSTRSGLPRGALAWMTRATARL